MHINNLDASTATVGRPHTADNSLYRISSRRSRRLSARSSTTSSSAAGTSDRDSFSTALDTFARPLSEGGLRTTSNDDDSAPRMGSTTTITAAAAAQAAAGSNWPGGIMRETDIQVESRELAGLDAELRRRSKYLPRDDGRWPPGREHEALRDLANFLRDVTPPPGNYMSVRTPTSPSISSSGASSFRRKNSSRKVSTLRRCLGVLMRKGNGKTKNLSKRHSNGSLNSVSRSPSVRKRRWHSRIRLPDTAVAGTTVEGHRHIAISIPIEYAHIGPEPKYKFPKRDKRRRSRSTADGAPRVYNDINVRPLSALVSEPHIGTQLGPVAEERESLSSKTPSWENPSSGSGSRAGGLHHPAEVRRVRLASRNTFGTVHEEFGSPSGSNSANNSRPATRSGSSPTRTPLTPPRRSSSGEYIRPRTPASSGRSSDEVVRKSHRMGALAALTSSASRPSSSSAHSLRSFASASPGGTTGRVYYPKRNSSLQPPFGPDTPTDHSGGKVGRGRGRVGQGQGLQYAQQRQHSRDSSRDQYTLQESIFSEPSYLESSHTVDSGNAAPGPTVSRGTTRDGTPSRKSDDSEAHRSGRTSQNSGDGKRWSLGTGAVAHEDGSKRIIKQSPLSGRVLIASRSAEPLRRPSRERLESENAARASGQSLQSKQVDPRAPIAVTQRMADEDGSSPSPDRDGRSSGTTQHVALLASPELVPGQAPGRQEKGKEREPPMVRVSPPTIRKSKSKDQQQGAHDQSPNFIPSPQERRQRRKTVVLSRKQRVAELRKALERPGAQPQDLLWERRLSSSSEESNGATPTGSPPHSPWKDRHPDLPRAQRRRPTTLPAHLSFTPVLTVADLRPSSPADSSEESNKTSSRRESVLLNKKDSIPLSLSSPTTVATIVKTSPVPPFQTLGSVTPPQSPHASLSSPSTPSPSSELYPHHEDQRSSVTGTPLRPQPPLKRLSSVRRRASLVGRPSPRPSSPIFEGMRGNSSPSRPKTAGKGGIHGSRQKDYFYTSSFGHDQPQQPWSQATVSSPITSPTSTSSWGNRVEDAGGPGVVATASGSDRVKSALKMTRSELFERYEAVRDKQSRDLERRLRRLEKHGDYWLTSMLPLLTDLSQTLGQLALNGSDRPNQPQQQNSNSGKGKEREATVEDIDDDHEDEVRRAIYADGRKSRFGTRSTPAVNLAGLESFPVDRPSTSSFEPSGEIIRRHGRGRSNTAGSGRVYLHDGSEASHHPGIGYRVRVEDHEMGQEAEADDGDRPDRLSSMSTTPNRHYGRTSAKSTPPRKHQQQYHQAPSPSTTMVDNIGINNAPRADSFGNTSGSFRRMHRSSSSLHDTYKKHNTKRSYALHANAPLAVSTTQLLSEQVAAERERLVRIERLNDHIDARIRSLPSSRSHDTDASIVSGSGGGGGGGGGLLPPPRSTRLVKRSEESLETYRGSTSGEEGDSEIEDVSFDVLRRMREPHRPFFGIEEMAVGRRGRGTGMEVVTPIMRELQANGSRLSLESEGSCGEGDFEVRALRRGPEPRRQVGFGAFR